MKLSYSCPKCQNSEIAIIESGAFKGNMYNTITFGITSIYLTKYVCLDCGFTENYVNNTEDLEKLRKKYLKPGEGRDFV